MWSMFEADVEWRRVPGHENYAVSSDGQVRREVRIYRCSPGLLKQSMQGTYPSVAITIISGVYKTVTVHKLVALAFIGPRPLGQVVRHLDGNPINCHASNLAYGTYSDNAQDAIRHGTQVRGARQHFAVATDEIARAVKVEFVAGAKQLDLARVHGISTYCVNSMVIGETWTHIAPFGDLRLLRVAPRVYGSGGRPKTSQYEGVCWDARSGRWRAYRMVDGKHKSFGSHKTEEAANQSAIAGRIRVMLDCPGTELTRKTPSGRRARVWEAV